MACHKRRLANLVPRHRVTPGLRGFLILLRRIFHSLVMSRPLNPDNDKHTVLKELLMEERRQHSRVQWVSPGRIDFEDGSPPLICLVHDLSNGGARLTSLTSDKLPDTFKLCLAPSRGPSPACRIVWRSKRAVGVAFLQPFPVSKEGEAVKQHA